MIQRSYSLQNSIQACLISIQTDFCSRIINEKMDEKLYLNELYLITPFPFSPTLISDIWLNPTYYPFCRCLSTQCSAQRNHLDLKSLATQFSWLLTRSSDVGTLKMDLVWHHISLLVSIVYLLRQLSYVIIQLMRFQDKNLVNTGW